MDIVGAVRTYLAAQYDVVGVLGYDEIFYEQSGGWIFQEKLAALVEGSSRPPMDLEDRSVAVVLHHRGNWTAPNEHNTMRFPRLLTEFHADPDRNESNHIIDPLSAKDKIIRAHEAIDLHLHRPYSGAVVWGGQRILRSTRLGELEFSAVPDGDGVMRAQVFYAIGVG